MDSSPVNRAIFDGKQRRWLPLEKMPNLTGWDRDQGQAVTTQTLQAAQFWEEEPEFDYFDIWKEWLQNRPAGRVTVRQAQQGAPRQVRVNAAGTREAFKQLERMDFGTFDRDGDAFIVATVAIVKAVS